MQDIIRTLQGAKKWNYIQICVERKKNTRYIMQHISAQNKQIYLLPINVLLSLPVYYETQNLHSGSQAFWRERKEQKRKRGKKTLFNTTFILNYTLVQIAPLQPTSYNKRLNSNRIQTQISNSKVTSVFWNTDIMYKRVGSKRKNFNHEKKYFMPENSQLIIVLYHFHLLVSSTHFTCNTVCSLFKIFVNDTKPLCC